MISAMLLATVLLIRVGQKNNMPMPASTPTFEKTPTPPPAPAPVVKKPQAAFSGNITAIAVKTAHNEESLFVIDQDQERLYIYRVALFGAGGSIELSDIIELDEVFGFVPRP